MKRWGRGKQKASTSRADKIRQPRASLSLLGLGELITLVLGEKSKSDRPPSDTVYMKYTRYISVGKNSVKEERSHSYPHTLTPTLGSHLDRPLWISQVLLRNRNILKYMKTFQDLWGKRMMWEEKGKLKLQLNFMAEPLRTVLTEKDITPSPHKALIPSAPPPPQWQFTDNTD